MIWNLSFSTLVEYDPGQPGINIPVILRLADREAPCLAKIDTGASDCIFRRFQGEPLGLDIERGDPRDFSTATGSFKAYGHAVSREHGVRLGGLFRCRRSIQSQCTGQARLVEPDSHGTD